MKLPTKKQVRKSGSVRKTRLKNVMCALSAHMTHRANVPVTLPRLKFLEKPMED